MKLKRETKMFTSVKKHYKLLSFLALCILLCGAFVFAKNKYSNPDFGATFGAKAKTAKKKLQQMRGSFELCSGICNSNALFMQSIVFPEVMRFHELKDDIETESLRTLYVQFGKEYANFSIGLFQMKPSFAEELEQKAKQLLPNELYNELQLTYKETDVLNIRLQRVQRLQDDEWQLIYLTTFISVCDKLYAAKKFNSEYGKLQWYASVYNAGFDKSDAYIIQKIKQENFYLQQGMPGKKFRYAAIATWYYNSILNSKL
jgi:hypothetical protein